MSDRKKEIRLDEIGGLRNDISDSKYLIQFTMDALEQLEAFKNWKDYDNVIHWLKTVHKRLEGWYPKTDEMYYEWYLGFRKKVIKDGK